jgi:hypothetical protein
VLAPPKSVWKSVCDGGKGPTIFVLFLMVGGWRLEVQGGWFLRVTNNEVEAAPRSTPAIHCFGTPMSRSVEVYRPVGTLPT